MSSKSISPSELAKRYADALLQEAVEHDAVDAVAGEMEELAQLIEKNRDFRLLLSAAVITKSERRETLAALAKKAGLSDILCRFLGVLTENERTGLLALVCSQFHRLREAYEGYVDADVVCAVKPDDDVVGRLTRTLATVCGKKIRLNVTVDDSLIGGMTVRVGSAYIDGSVKSKLQKLNQVMKGVGL